MILLFPSFNNKSLVRANFEAAKRFHSIVTNYFNVTDNDDVDWYRWSVSWLDYATTRMRKCL